MERSMDDRPPFGLVLKRLRLAAGLTHEALAERASLGARTISDLERGVSRAPRAETLALLLSALDVTPEQRALLQAAARPHLVTSGSPVTARGRDHLPVSLTSFVGREAEAAVVCEFLGRDDRRLVTLTGPGGVGKTRLALHVAAHVAEAFPDGAVAVDLVPVTDADGICTAITEAVGANAEGPRLASLIAAVEDKRLLLVLDNFEHVLAAAPLVTDLLRRCRQLKILVTSRAALRLSGEQVFPVPPLPVPDPAHLPAVAALSDYAAIRLFIDQAMRVRPDFTLTSDNAADVAAICALLDGLPLAIELAAARVRTLPPRSLMERLHASQVSPLGVLALGPRDAPARQQTLRSTIAWSYGLLAATEQALFRRLAVFSGGGTLDAVEAICGTLSGLNAADRQVGSAECGGEINVLDGLDALIDNSLVLPDEGTDGAPRFRLLETVRAYAWEQLAVSGEEAEMRRRHADYYLGLVRATGALLFAAPQTRARQAAENGNVHVALQWFLQHG
jgi:predicted ATPase/transcriptional regulator with XRE-family HTH domain